MPDPFASIRARLRPPDPFGDLRARLRPVADVSATRPRQRGTVTQILAQPPLEDLLRLGGEREAEAPPSPLARRPTPAVSTAAPRRAPPGLPPSSPSTLERALPAGVRDETLRYRERRALENVNVPGGMARAAIASALPTGVGTAVAGPVGGLVGALATPVARRGLEAAGAAVRAALGPSSFREELAAERGLTTRFREAHPVATFAGELAGFGAGPALATPALGRSLTRTLQSEAGRIGTGSTKFKAATDEEVADQYVKLLDRAQKSGQQMQENARPWTRYDDDIAEQRSGTVLNYAFGRAKGALVRDERLIAEAEEELAKRGFVPEQVEALRELGLTGTVSEARAALPLRKPIVATEPFPVRAEEEIPLPAEPPFSSGSPRPPRKPPPSPPQPVPGQPPPSPRVPEFAKLRTFGLDPEGEQILAQQVSEIIREGGDLLRRPVTWDETKQAAQALGLSQADLARSTVRRLSGAETLAIRNTVHTNVSRMQEATRALADPFLAENKRQAMTQQLARLDEQNDALLRRFVTARNQTGRDLNNLKILANRVDDPVFWFTKGLHLVGPERWAQQGEAIRTTILRHLEAKQPEELVGYLTGLRRATPLRKLTTYFKANLLTNPLTHVVNISSNTTFQAMEAAKDAPAALADRLMGLATGQRTVTGPSGQAAKASLDGVRRGLAEARRVMQGAGPENALQRWDIPVEVNFDNAILDTYTKTVFRSLGAEDRIFRGAALESSLVNQARALAMQEGKRGAAVATRAQEILAAPSDEMVLRATADAEQAVFQDQTAISRLLRGVARSGGGAGEFVVPFSRTPGAIATRTIEYSPAGLVGGVYQTGRVLTRAFQGKDVPPELQRQAARLFGRGATGTAVVWAGYQLAALDRMRATTDLGDQAQRDTNRLLGTPDAAIRVGDSWVEVLRLNPFGNLLVLGANLRKIAEQPNTTPSQLAVGGAGAVARGLTDQPFLTGVSRALEAVQDPTSRTAGRMVENVVGGMVPAASLLAGVARGTDPGFRQPTDLSGFLASRIPGASRTQPPAVTPFGESAKREGGLPAALFNPLRVTRDKTRDDVVRAELARLGVTLGARRPVGERGTAETRALVQEEGPQLFKALLALIQSPAYQQADDAAKAEAIETRITRLRSRYGRRYPTRGDPFADLRRQLVPR